LSGLLVIVNPEAGRGRARREWDEVRRRLQAAGIAFDAFSTTRRREAAEIAEKESHSRDCIVAAGGDGTVHEVVNGLMRAGGKAAFGLIPLGSGDDFEKLLSGTFIQRFLNRKAKRFDVGRIVSGGETRYFANGMDIGFGAHGAANVARVPRFLTGFGAYLGALFLTMVRYPKLAIDLRIDDGPPERVTTAMTAAMNGTTFGGSFRVCPDARPDDGLLDLLVVDAIGRLSILQLVPKILKGAHAGDRRLRMARARRLTLESGEPLLVEADGEIAFERARRLEIDVLPGALRVLAG
jgi:diacylglycerol kinase (ATP)